MVDDISHVAPIESPNIPSSDILSNASDMTSTSVCNTSYYGGSFSDVVPIFGLDTFRGCNDSVPETLGELNQRYAESLLPLTIILGIMGVVGLVGNTLVFIVYGCGHKFKDKKFRYYVLSLAVIDFITCLTLIPAEMLKHISYFNFTESVLCKMKCFFNVFAAGSASYCLLLIAVDRYIMTCHPLLFAKMPAFSQGAAWRLCLLMLVLGVVTAIPSAIMCGVTTASMTDANGHMINVTLCKSEPYYEAEISRYVYRGALCVTQALVSVIMVILYARIGHAIMKFLKLRELNEKAQEKGHETIPLHDYQHPDYRYHGQHAQHSRHLWSHLHLPHHHHLHHHPHIPSNIKLLFSVTLVFIVTYTFYIALSWVDQTKLTPTQFVFFSMFFRLYFIHSIINPILYTKMDRYFRKRCFNLLRGKFKCGH